MLPQVLIGLRVLGIASALGGLLWLVDEIGDRREAKVRAEIAREVDAANRRAAEAQSYWAAQYERDMAERAVTMQRVLSESKGVVGCAPAPELVERLNLINPRRR